MADEMPVDLAAVVERIAAPETNDIDLPADVTGALRDLLAWWKRVSSTAPLRSTWVTSEADAAASDAVMEGVRAADRAIDAGATLLVPRVGRRDDVAARTIIALFTRKEASAVIDQPVGMTDLAWMETCAAVRDHAAAWTTLRGEPLGLLASAACPEIAGTVGVLLGAAARRTACLVDGTDELAAALVADRLCYRAKSWWREGASSPDPGRAAAFDRIDMAAGLPLALTDDEGRGAQATLALLDLLA